MNIKILLLVCAISTNSFSEIKNEKYEKVLEEKEIIVLVPKKPKVEEKKAEDINCSYGNYMDCAEKKYNKIEGQGFFDKVSTVFAGDKKTVEVEVEEEETSIGEDIENFGSSIWTGTKGLASDAGVATKKFIKRKFDESWEDAKKQVEEDKKAKRLAREKARGKVKDER